MKKVTYHTLGCKLNFAETSNIGKQFIERDFVEVSNEEPANVIVVNTCSVTERADQKARQIVRHIQKVSPDAFIIVTGCYAQLDPEQIAEIPGVDLVLGSKEKFKIFDYIDSFEKSSATRIFTTPIEDVHEFGGAYSLEVGNRTRVFLKVQDGCDYSCTYCTIPMARGKSRSTSIDNIVRQANEIAEKGMKEIVLTGVNVGTFGATKDENLLQLIRLLDKIDGIERYRISSIEPNLLTDEIIDFIGSSNKFCHHFHVPMQSGSDSVLKRMKRRYLSADYRKRIEKIKSVFPDAGIGADMIVGFPGETDEYFEETAHFINSLPLTYLHVFTYSERENTEAVELDGTVSNYLRKKRNAHLRILSRKKENAFKESLLGTISEVLIEGDEKDNLMYGYTGNYARVGVKNSNHLINTIQKVKIIGYDDDMDLLGEIII